MKKKCFLNGGYFDENENRGIGVGLPKYYMDEFEKCTLPDHKIKVSHNGLHCILDWEPLEGADSYRVDLYKPVQMGPVMDATNYICTDCAWTKETTYITREIPVYESCIGIVFAHKDGECIGRYKSVFCIGTPDIVGDMLADEEENFLTKTVFVGDGVSFKLAPLCAEKSVLLNSNPDRGWRSEEDYFVPTEDKIPDWTAEDYYNDAVRRFEKNVLGEKVTISRVYFILENYVNVKVLPQKVIDYMQGYYDAYRKMGVKMYLGHYYQHGHTKPQVPQDVVLSHFEQLTPLFKKNADVIYVFCMNWLGCYGEWTCMREPMDFQLFVDTALKLIPKELRILMRHNYTKKMFVEESNPRYKEIGIANEALHGLKYPNIDVGQGFSQPGSEWWENVKNESVYTINDGELFTTRGIRLVGSWSSGISNMEVFSEQHLTTVSVQHGYGDICQFGGEKEETNIYAWKSEEITEELLDSIGMHATPAWFIDGSGERVKRNAFEYVRDHLGYRLSFKNVELAEKDGKLAVNVSLKNYGVGAAFNLKSGFAIIGKDGKVICEVDAGNPAVWYTTDPENFENREVLTHKISATLPLEGTEDSYYLAFYLKGTLNNARLDNSIAFKNGYNILCEIKEKG